MDELDCHALLALVGRRRLIGPACYAARTTPAVGARRYPIRPLDESII